MARVLIVSNRLPVTVSVVEGRPEVTPSTGGLATGLMGPHERSKGLWFGWPGDLSQLTESDRATVHAQMADLRTVPIEISSAEFDGYYTGMANGVLWPLFHYLIDRIPYQQQEWESYRAVNQRFAEAVAKQYREGDLIWVQDYQLMLLPSMLRASLPKARIGFFLHIPFPASEVFRLLPWREEVLRGLLGADVIGFHTFSYVRQFINSLIHTLGLMPRADRLDYEGRQIKLGVYPMGVDAGAFDANGRDPEVQDAAARLRAELGDTKMLLGIDRLDYTKGIPRRLLAGERLLELKPELQGKLRFVQVAVPSRAEVPQYETFTAEVQQLVGRINGRFSTPSSVPIHFLHQSFAQRELVAFYLATDVMLVTPLRDGMNLVAKEFVASRVDDDGVLLLSEFAGAASEMGEAVMVNPYDVETTARRIGEALEMPSAARRLRMKALRERVLTHDVHRWADEFVRDLEAPRAARRRELATPGPGELGERLRRASRIVWLLDYDGTLVPFAERPEFASPDPELVELLGALARSPRMAVHIVSGRPPQVLGDWLGHLPLGLHAEHGLWSRLSGTDWRFNARVETGWKDVVRPMLHEFALRTPGSLVEEKTASLAFHYRMADLEYGKWQARELKIHLAHVLSNMPVEILSGSRVIEIKPHGVNKGLVVPNLLAGEQGALVVAAGDDETDEFLFRALPEDALSIGVGPRRGSARFSLPSVEAMRATLRSALE